MLYFGQERLPVTKFAVFPLLFCPKYHVQLFISAFLPHTPVWAMDTLWALSMPTWENPHPNFNYNLIVMWKGLIVNGFWWNWNMLFILVVSNSLGKVFEINQSLLNCCVVKKFAFVISRSCSAPQCVGYLRDLALFDQPLFKLVRVCAALKFLTIAGLLLNYFSFFITTISPLHFLWFLSNLWNGPSWSFLVSNALDLA